MKVLASFLLLARAARTRYLADGHGRELVPTITHHGQKRRKTTLTVSSDELEYDIEGFKVKGLWFDIDETRTDGFGQQHYIGSQALGKPTSALKKMMSPMSPKDRYNHIIDSYYKNLGVWPNFPVLKDPKKVVNPIHHTTGTPYSAFNAIGSKLTAWPWSGQVVHKEVYDSVTPDHVWDLKNKLCTDLSPAIKCSDGFFNAGSFGALFKATVYPQKMQELGLQFMSGCNTLENKFDRKQIINFLRLSKYTLQELINIGGGSGEIAGQLWGKDKAESFFRKTGVDYVAALGKTLAKSEFKDPIFEKVRDYLSESGNWYSPDMTDEEVVTGFLHAWHNLGFHKRYYVEEPIDNLAENGWSESNEPFAFPEASLIRPWEQISSPNSLGKIYSSMATDAMIIAAEVVGWKFIIQEDWPGIPTWSSSGPLCTIENKVIDLQPKDILVKLQLSDSPEADVEQQRYVSQKTISSMEKKWKEQNEKMLLDNQFTVSTLYKYAHSVVPEQGVGDGLWLLGDDAVLESTRHRKAYRDDGSFAPASYEIVTQQLETMSDKTKYFRPLGDTKTIIFMDMVVGLELGWMLQNSCVNVPSIHKAFLGAKKSSSAHVYYKDLVKRILPPEPMSQPRYWDYSGGIGFVKSSSARPTGQKVVTEDGVEDAKSLVLPSHPAKESFESVYGAMWRTLLVPALKNERQLQKALDTFQAHYVLYYRDRALILQMVQRRIWTLFDRKMRHCDLHGGNIFVVPTFFNPLNEPERFHELIKSWIMGRSVILYNYPERKYKSAFKSEKEPDLGTAYILPVDGTIQAITDSFISWYKTQRARHDAGKGSWLHDGLLPFMHIDNVVDHVAFIDVAYLFQYDVGVPLKDQLDGCRYRRGGLYRSSDVYEQFANWNQSTSNQVITDFNYKTPSLKTAINKMPRVSNWMGCSRTQDMLTPRPKGIPESMALWTIKDGDKKYNAQELVDFYIDRYQSKTWRERNQPNFLENDKGLWFDLFANVYKDYFNDVIKKNHPDRHVEARIDNALVHSMKKYAKWWKTIIYDVNDLQPGVAKMTELYNMNPANRTGAGHNGTVWYYVVKQLYKEKLLGRYEWIADYLSKGWRDRTTKDEFDWMTRVYARMLAKNPPDDFPEACFEDRTKHILIDPYNWHTTCVDTEWLQQYRAKQLERMVYHRTVGFKELSSGGLTGYDEDAILIHMLRTTRSHLKKYEDELMPSAPWFRHLKWGTYQDRELSEYMGGTRFKLNRGNIENEMPVFSKDTGTKM